MPGATAVRVDGALALAGGRPVQADILIDDLWGEHPPAGAATALQGLVSRLRRVLGELSK